MLQVSADALCSVSFPTKGAETLHYDPTVSVLWSPITRCLLQRFRLQVICYQDFSSHWKMGLSMWWLVRKHFVCVRGKSWAISLSSPASFSQHFYFSKRATKIN